MPNRYREDHPAGNLPDSFAKTPESNNYKVLEIERRMATDFSHELQALDDGLDLSLAYGKTLDYYGEMYGQPRGVATDSQYRYMIRAKSMRNLSSGDYPSIRKAICHAFRCDQKLVSISEDDAPCVVKIAVLPLSVINSAGLTVNQTTAMIKQLLPVGVRLESILFDGTFEFSDKADALDQEHGFADINGTYGGYFGLLSGGNEDATVLPI